MAAAAHQRGSPPLTTASAPSTYITGLRKNPKVIANRSRQPAVRSSSGIGSTPYPSTAGTTDGLCGCHAGGYGRSGAAVSGEEVDHGAVVLLGVVEDRRVGRALDDVLLGGR